MRIARNVASNVATTDRPPKPLGLSRFRAYRSCQISLELKGKTIFDSGKVFGGPAVRKVLIAEDDLMIADFLEEVLVDGGFDVCGIARTVTQGLALAQLHQPDIAILDLRLAFGGFGTEIAAGLDRKAGLGILYATGNAHQFVLTKNDGDACLDKPFRPDDVIRGLQLVDEITATGKASGPFPSGFRVLEGSEKTPKPPKNGKDYRDVA
jgi:CheY-like chemotaxis protein